MSKKYAMYIGRWQNWHKGHEWLINQQLEKGKDVWVAIRNVPTDENNPKTAQEVMMELVDEPFFKDNSHKIQISIIPDIESVNYGRGVGYEVKEIKVDKEIANISATEIRKQILNGENGWKYFVDESIHTYLEDCFKK